jgi:RNA methyltransferase, TrmH family
MPARPTIVGVNACLAVLRARPGAIRRAWVTEEARPRVRDLTRELARQKRPYRVTTDAEIRKVSGAVHHEGVCVEAPPPPAPTEAELQGELAAERGPARLVYLDGVQNPHNVGAMLRTCAHLGVRALLGAAGELPRLAGAAMRTAEGGAEYVPVVPLERPMDTLARLQRAGFAIVATAADAAHDLYASELSPRAVFVLGAERAGVSEPIRGRADSEVSIPGSGPVDSLNVAAACAVLLADHVRRFGL